MSTFRMLCGVILSFAFVAGAVAQDKMEGEKKMMEKKAMKASTWQGHLVDQMCGKKMGSGDAERSKARAMKHTKACAQEEACAESGYGLVHEGMWHKFDEAGDKLAVEWLNATDVKDDLMVEVTGTVEGDVINVASIKPVEMKRMDKKMEKKEEMKKM